MAGKETPRRAKPGAGLDMVKKARIVGTKTTGLEDDPEIAAGVEEDAETVGSMDSELDVEKTMSEALELVTQPTVRSFPLGNGTTIPYPYDGEDSTEFSQCSPSSPTNRGCRFHSLRGKPRCPFGTGHPLAVKHGFEGPANLVYKDKRSGLVKTCFCTEAMNSYLHQGNIIFLPGVEWFPTRTAEYKPLPNGQQPTPGPNQPRTPIVLKPHKTQLVCVPPADLVREFQQMRRRGDFQIQPRRQRR